MREWIGKCLLLRSILLSVDMMVRLLRFGYGWEPLLDLNSYEEDGDGLSGNKCLVGVGERGT